MALKNEFVKKANQEQEYTPEQVQELLRCQADPVYFITTYMKVQHPVEGTVPLKLYTYQERAIRSFQNNRWVCLKQPRQTGKSTIIAAYLLWYACFNFDKYILVASNKNAGAIDIMNRIRFAYEELPMWLKPGASVFNRHSVEFDNGSSINSSATTENTGRGRSISLLMLDELAFVEPSIQEEMWTALAPTLATGGSCIVSSTPNGDLDLYARIWFGAEAGENGFVPMAVSWDETPGRDESFRDEMIAKIGLEKWAQEFACEFISSDDLLIHSITLANLKHKDPIFKDHGFIFWKQPSPHSTYIVGVDIAQGLGRDYSTIQVVELDTLTQIAEFRNNKIKEPELYEAIKWICAKLLSVRTPQGKRPSVHWSYENNSVGASITAMYSNDEFFPHEAELVSKGQRLGINTSGRSKATACKTLKTLIEKAKGGLVINSPVLIRELKTYVRAGDAFAAKFGHHDDLISAMLIVAQVITQLSEYEPDVFSKLYETEGEFHRFSVANELDEEYGGDDPMPFVF